MHILAAALAAHTEAPPNQSDTGWFGTAWNWAGEHVPGGNLTTIGALFVLGLLADGANKKTGTTKTDWHKPGQAVVGGFKKLFGSLRALVLAVWAVLRFYGGRELRGEPRSTATFLRAGTPLDRPAVAQAVSMASVAAAAPKVSLVKPVRRQPSPWARNAAAWLNGYRGRGAAALDRAVRAALWSARTAGRVWRCLRAVWRALTAAYSFTAPIVTTLARTLRSWHCWPYAARGLARLVLTAALVGLAVPAWRVWTIVGLVLVAAGACVLAHRYRPRPPGDDAVYGPRIWVILREDLGLPEDEPRGNWLLLPERLADPDARIVIRLPWTWRGSEGDRENLSALVNSRLPGEWVARVSLTGDTFTAVYTHKPPPKPPAPEPTPPDSVDFFDPEIQEAIANCERGQIVIGRDAFGQIIIKTMGDGETPHWALSVGTGGGKSAFCQMVIAQLIAQGYYILAADVKRVSVANYIGVVGCYIYNDPMNPQDMRAGIDWFKEEIAARSAISEADPTAEFPGILCLIEEANEFADVSREWWDDNRKTRSDEFGPADRAADPVWGTVASGARLGRHVYGNILAVFQDLRDQALGGKGLRNLFRLKFMGNFNKNSWDNVVGTKPVPESIDKAGRMMIVEGNAQYWVQTLYAKPEALRAWAIEARERTGFVEGAGLYGAPPQPSPKTLPRRRHGVGRGKLPEGLQGASEGGLSDETAGHGVTLDGSVTPGVTPGVTPLRLVPGQAGPQAHEDPQNPLAAPVLLTIAEVAHELATRGYAIKANTISQHKSRRDKGVNNGFPVGIIGKDGKERWTLDQLRAYYEGRGIERTEESETEAEQDDAV